MPSKWHKLTFSKFAMPRSFGTVSSDSSGPAIHDRKIEPQQTFFRNQIVLEIRVSQNLAKLWGGWPIKC